MSNDKLLKLVLVFMFVLVVSVFISDLFKSCGSNNKPEVIIKTDTLTITKIVEKPFYITKIKARLDTLIINDTLFVGKDSIEIIASADTIISKDSSTIAVKYYYPPKNYFEIKANIKSKEITKVITNTVEKPTGFFDRFNLVIYAGQGYDFIHKDYHLGIGFGVGFNLTNIF